jgi:hypothetical protein
MTESLAQNAHTGDRKALWNFRRLTYAFIISFVLQQLFLPCLCSIGTAKIALAIVVDGLVVARAIVAYIIRERGSGWIFYAVLLYSSAGWIMIASRIVLGPDGW